MGKHDDLIGAFDARDLSKWLLDPSEDVKRHAAMDEKAPGWRAAYQQRYGRPVGAVKILTVDGPMGSAEGFIHTDEDDLDMRRGVGYAVYDPLVVVQARDRCADGSWVKLTLKVAQVSRQPYVTGIQRVESEAV